MTINVTTPNAEPGGDCHLGVLGAALGQDADAELDVDQRQSAGAGLWGDAEADLGAQLRARTQRFMRLQRASGHTSCLLVSGARSREARVQLKAPDITIAP